MCGRYAYILPKEAMAQMFSATSAPNLMPTPNYNICPTQNISVAVSFEGERVLTHMRWGFVPHWYTATNDGPLLLNARAETIAEKPAYRAACRERRCLVAASGYYEWTKDSDESRLPWYIKRNDGEAMAMAGIWQDWTTPDGIAAHSVAVVTTGANEQLGQIHHRMPVTIEPADFGLWLGEEGKGAATLMQAASNDVFDFHRVDRAVNSNRARGPELIVPWED